MGGGRTTAGNGVIVDVESASRVPLLEDEDTQEKCSGCTTPLASTATCSTPSCSAFGERHIMRPFHQRHPLVWYAGSYFNPAAWWSWYKDNPAADGLNWGDAKHNALKVIQDATVCTRWLFKRLKLPDTAESRTWVGQFLRAFLKLMTLVLSPVALSFDLLIDSLFLLQSVILKIPYVLHEYAGKICLVSVGLVLGQLWLGSAFCREYAHLLDNEQSDFLEPLLQVLPSNLKSSARQVLLQSFSSPNSPLTRAFSAMNVVYASLACMLSDPALLTSLLWVMLGGALMTAVVHLTYLFKGKDFKWLKCIHLLFYTMSYKLIATIKDNVHLVDGFYSESGSNDFGSVVEGVLSKPEYANFSPTNTTQFADILYDIEVAGKGALSGAVNAAYTSIFSEHIPALAQDIITVDFLNWKSYALFVAYIGYYFLVKGVRRRYIVEPRSLMDRSSPTSDDI